MQILYVKYNRERHAKYQIKTTIKSNPSLQEFSSLFVVKSALTNEAEEHIQKIYSNYHLLKENYKQDALVEPLSYKKGEVTFEYIKGESLESLLLKAVHADNHDEFLRIISLFKKFLHNIAGNNYCDFENSVDFTGLFGEYITLKGLKCFTISNIDLNLDNIMLNEVREMKIIDYEWVYPFAIPINFIIFRAFNSFYYSHYLIMQHFLTFDKLLAWGGVSETEVNVYIRMSQKFASAVGTDEKKANLNKYLKKIIRPNYAEPVDYKAQVFIDEGQGFSEKHSTYFSLTNSINILSVNLSEYKNVSRLRFDPLQGKGTVQIKKVVFKTADGTIYEPLVEYSNSILNLENYYIFDQEDPQIYYKTEDQCYDKLEIEMIYFTHVPYELIVTMNENHNFLLDSKNTIEQNWRVVQNEVQLLQRESDEYKLSLEKMRKENLNLSLKCEQQENELRNKEKLIAGGQKELEEVNQLLAEKNRDISYMINTKWWKVRERFYKILKRR